MKFFLIYFSPLFFLILAFSNCQKQEDPRISQLQKDVRQLSEENKNLKRELSGMQEEMKTPQTAQSRPAAPQTAPVPKEPEMTVDQMKRDLQPLLIDFIQKLKAAGETPRKGNQYGMRIEYDLTKAVYGLVKNDDADEPFRGKVIVPYKKFLESETDSRFYGDGTTQFFFTFQDRHWSLQTFE